jgi:uncharacterized protein (DUF1684 family)
MLCLLIVNSIMAQSSEDRYNSAIELHRRQYKEDFTDHPHSPVTAADTALIDFFLPDKTWEIQAKFTITPGSRPFDLPSYAGKSAKYKQYGKLMLEHKGITFSLSIYQSLSLMKDSAFRNYLFLPFTDLTNGETTYEGGRYLDFSIGDIQDGILEVDFNRCYNPYCAYSDGYSCPVPPAENRLQLAIPAGEKKFLKTRK